VTSSDRSIQERLHEALGEPMTPAQIAALDARLERGRSRGVPFMRGRAMRRSLLLVAVVIIVLPLAALAGIIPGGDHVPLPPGLEDRVTGLFSEDACITPQRAEEQIDAIFADLGYTGWSVGHGTGAADTECVVASLDGETKTITLLMALSPEVADGLEVVREQLYSECGTREDAYALVEAVLAQAGMENWEIRTDGPGISGPSDRIEEIERHVDNGCWVYTTTGWTDAGKRVFWIAGS
jgi:hypothetical protein